MKPKIVLYVDSSLYGGIESHILELSKLLKANGLTVTVLFCMDRNNQQFYKALDEINCSVEFINGTLRGLHHFLKLRPDVLLHSHGYRAGISARLVCTLLKRPCVSTYHAGESGLGKVRLYNWLDKFTSFLSHNFVVSQQLKSQVHKSVVLDNFVHPLPLVSDKPETLNQIRVGFVGRLSFEKGPDIFAKLAELNARNRQLSFHLYGDGPMYSQLSNNQNLTLHGHQQEASFWQSIDILVISSRQEGLPMVLLEAMNRGIVVITTPVGAVAKVVENKDNGFVTNEISAEALNLELKYYRSLTDEQRAKMRRYAQRTIHEKFSGQAQMNKLLATYYSLAAASSHDFILR